MNGYVVLAVLANTQERRLHCSLHARTATSTTTSMSAPVGRSCAGNARRRDDDVPPLPSRARRPQPPLPLALHGVRLRRMEMSDHRIVEKLAGAAAEAEVVDR